MPIAKHLVTWKYMDVEAIESAYNEIASKIAGNYPDKKTREFIKKEMEDRLPEYEIICDETNNSSTVIDSGNVVVRVRTRVRFDGSYGYIDVIF